MTAVEKCKIYEDNVHAILTLTARLKQHWMHTPSRPSTLNSTSKIDDLQRNGQEITVSTEFHRRLKFEKNSTHKTLFRFHNCKLPVRPFSKLLDLKE